MHLLIGKKNCEVGKILRGISRLFWFFINLLVYTLFYFMGIHFVRILSLRLPKFQEYVKKAEMISESSFACWRSVKYNHIYTPYFLK